MRLHVVALPHTQVTKEFGVCAYTQKVRKFCNMMSDRGHVVYLYCGADGTDARVHEWIPCVSEHTRREAVGDDHYVNVPWFRAQKLWQEFNDNAELAIRKRHLPKDIICVIGGLGHKPLTDRFPHPAHIIVEFGIGYSGHYAPFRVFESYAWMHMNYGADTQHGDPSKDMMNYQGRFSDVVIPNFFEKDAFPLVTTKKDYVLFIGRLVDLKGYQIAIDACRAVGMPICLAGIGAPPKEQWPKGVEYIGALDEEERGKWMSEATAVMVPTRYVEPFGGVAVEAMFCGTPQITTPFGAFAETVIDDITGFRCHTLREFATAINMAHTLDPVAIRYHAASRYSLEAVAPQYERYFNRILELWDGDWF